MIVKIIGSEEEFKKSVLDKKDSLVVVYFYAQWCGPCKMFSGTYEDVAKNQVDVDFYKVDIDVLCNVASEYGIMSIPTIIAFKGGKEVNRQIGVPEDFSAWVDSNKK